MSRLCLILEEWAPLAIAAALGLFTLSLFGCTISPAPIFSPASVEPVTKQAQVAIAASKSAGALNTLGAIAIIIGAVCCAVPVIPNGLGFGLVGGGLICVLAGILLPVYAVWIGWGLVGAVALFYLGRYLLERDERNLFGAPQKDFPQNA
jgi:hypothetical protein